MNKYFSKIWIIVTALVIISGGILVWQTGWTQKVEDEAAKCSPIDIPNYEIAKTEKGDFLEFWVDLNGDQKEEFVRVYKERDREEMRTLPIMVKIFSGSKDCPKEEFSYKAINEDNDLFANENEVYIAEVMRNFWGDGRNVVMVQGDSTAYGSGSIQQLQFFTWQNGKYVVVEGPSYSWWQGGASGYMFAGENGKGTKIILAKFAPKYLDDEYGSILPYYQFDIYDWNGHQYIGTKAGTTKNKYSWHWWEEDSEKFIKKIIQAEPEVLKPVEERHG